MLEQEEDKQKQLGQEKSETGWNKTQKPEEADRRVSNVGKGKMPGTRFEEGEEDSAALRLSLYKQLGERARRENRLPPGYYQGPPKKYHEMDDMALCGTERWGPRGGKAAKISCPQDPTCKACVPGTMHKKALDMIIACLDPEPRLLRHQLFQSVLPAPSEIDRPLVVLAVTWDFMGMLLNWVCGRLETAHGNPFFDTVLLPRDLKSFALLAQLGFPVVLHPEKHFGGQPLLADAHKACQSMLFCTLHQLTEMGYDVMLHDVDLIWLRDPRDLILLNPQWNMADVIGASAPRMDSHGPLNSGLVFFRGNQKNVIFLRTMVMMTPILYWLNTDQVIYNALLRHWKFRQLLYNVLPRETILDTHVGNVKGKGTSHLVTSETYALHVVSNPKTKVTRLKLIGFWFLEDKCYRDGFLIPSKSCKEIEDFCVEPNVTAQSLFFNENI
mmetsp:Transcript_5050/g.6855  ORF Transcript_5050/g.6855 Transcript_5050/m.6855 type:complete len:442 (-) Transcript_5050:165-1490(-)